VTGSVPPSRCERRFDGSMQKCSASKSKRICFDCGSNGLSLSSVPLRTLRAFDAGAPFANFGGAGGFCWGVKETRAH
jgi:hypothetical protein